MQGDPNRRISVDYVEYQRGAKVIIEKDITPQRAMILLAEIDVFNNMNAARGVRRELLKTHL